MGVQEVIEGLNIYRAVEACGERVMRGWAETAGRQEVRDGFATIAEREGNHARALAERIVALGGQPGPSCVDEALAGFIAEAESTTEEAARFGLFNALVKGSGETAAALAACMGGIRTALEQGDAATKAMLQSIFIDEKLSMDWCAAYSPGEASAAAAAGASGEKGAARV